MELFVKSVTLLQTTLFLRSFQHIFLLHRINRYCLVFTDLNVKMTSVVLTTMHLFLSNLYVLFSGSFLNKHKMAHRLDCVISSCHTAPSKRCTLSLLFSFSPMWQTFDFGFFYRCGLTLHLKYNYFLAHSKRCTLYGHINNKVDCARQMCK